MSHKLVRGLSALLFALVLVVGLAVAQRATPPPPPGGPGGQGGPGQQSLPEFNPNYVAVADTYAGIGTVTMGEGVLLDDFSLTTDCTTGEGLTAGATGVVTADDGSEWFVPMEVNEGAGTVDMFNNCTGTGNNPDYLNELTTVVVDEAGEEITATIFADNYFELYINGVFVGRDNINFTPFNSSAARFQAAYPMTFAVRLADWEDHFGIGMEYDTYHIGDAGFIASFSNGVITNETWQCQPTYIAPLDDPACVVEDEFGNPDSSGCTAVPVCSTSNAEACRALHYPVPDDWMMPEFDDTHWLDATIYEANRVTNQRGYVEYAPLFGEAEFIWSQNLNLDNQVLCRLTVDAAP